jgi:NAD(P)-dependent dehydrogenase (short-subunit alcohol dehydrogenase family)
MAEILRQGIHRGTVALVTGGGTGIGRAVALDLARCGADIVICGRRPEPLEKAASEIEALGTRALAVPADIRDDAAVRHLVDSALGGRLQYRSGASAPRTKSPG